MKLDLLTNATVVDDAIRFVSQKSKENLKPTSGNDEDENRWNKPDYDEHRDQLEEEHEEEEAGETTAVTTNQIFLTPTSLGRQISRELIS